MAKLYLKIDVDFILVDKDDEKILNETYNKDTEYGIQLTCRSKEGADIDISFDVEPKNSEGGTLNHKLDNSELKIITIFLPLLLSCLRYNVFFKSLID